MPVLARDVSAAHVRSASSHGDASVRFDRLSVVIRLPTDTPLDPVRRTIWPHALPRSVSFAEVAMNRCCGLPPTVVKFRWTSVWCCHSFLPPSSIDQVLLRNHVTSPRHK